MINNNFVNRGGLKLLRGDKMAGVRQHVLPNFLLKGFASRRKGKEVFSWVYHINRPPYETNTSNISVENKFYETNEGATADPAMELVESSFALLTEKVRSMEGTTEINDKLIVDLFVHMVSRTKHLRDSMGEAAETLVGDIGNLLKDDGNLEAFVLANKEVFIKKMNTALGSLGIPDDLKNVLSQKLLLEILHNHKDVLHDMNNQIRQRLTNAMPQVSRDAHVKAILRNRNELSTPSFYAKFKWFGVSTDTPLVIGDVGCVCEISGKSISSLPIPSNSVVNLFLPVSTYKLLVGTAGTRLPEVNVDWLNRSTIEICRDFFVYYRREPAMDTLRAKIRTKSEMILSEQELSESAARSFGRFIKTK